MEDPLHLPHPHLQLMAVHSHHLKEQVQSLLHQEMLNLVLEDFPLLINSRVLQTSSQPHHKEVSYKYFHTYSPACDCIKLLSQFSSIQAKW